MDSSVQSAIDEALICAPPDFLEVLSSNAPRHSLFHPEFDFRELGVGGLSPEFVRILRRVIAARLCPLVSAETMDIKHVHCMVLHGPPGVGKTLIARRLAACLDDVKLKFANGYEILSSHDLEKVEELFDDAEADQKIHGDSSQLHVIVLDEIECLCSSRPSTKHGTCFSIIMDRVLAKLGGEHGLKNVLLFAITNRVERIDIDWLEVQVGLPDEAGRQEILEIHTAKMREKSLLDNAVSLRYLASQTSGLTGAELEGLLRAACSSALSRAMSVTDPCSTRGLGDLRVTQADIQIALNEVHPACVRSDEELAKWSVQGITRHQQSHEIRVTIQAISGRELATIEFKPGGLKQDVSVLRKRVACLLQAQDTPEDIILICDGHTLPPFGKLSEVFPHGGCFTGDAAMVTVVQRHRDFVPKVSKLPAQDLCYTNYVYVSKTDWDRLLAVSGQISNRMHIQINDTTFSVGAHEHVARGSIALNRIQRGFLRVSLGQEISVSHVPPSDLSDLESCLLEVDALQQQATDKTYLFAERELKQSLRRFEGQMLSVGQPFVFLQDGLIVKCTVLDTGGSKPGILNIDTQLHVVQGTSGILEVRTAE